MQEKPLHIVSFDNPFPPVYGGVIEVFYKLKPLHDLGIKIYFHCFVDEIPLQNPEIESVTHKIYYYKNVSKVKSFLSRVPLSVKRRSSNELLNNIAEIDAPILFESLRTTYLVFKNQIPERKIFLRMHNIEEDYFYGIAKSETNFLKKIAFYLEAMKFKRYEQCIGKFSNVATLSVFENQVVNKNFGNAVYLPVFHGNETVAELSGVGKYALYHGDLRVSDNKKVALRLVRIFEKIPDFQLVIASSNGKSLIEKAIGNSKNIHFTFIKDFNHLKQLLSEAQINLIFSFQRSGTKLKLMNSLFNSRFCIINENIMDDEKVTELCEFASSDAEISARINELKTEPFQDYLRRKRVLEAHMNDVTNANALAQVIFGKL